MSPRGAKGDQGSASSTEPAEIFLRLRGQILNLDPVGVGMERTATSPLAWGLVMETGYPNVIVTLVCISDGTTSLYTSSGSGVIGGGGHEAVVRENARALAMVNEHLHEMSPSTDQSLPGEGRTIIRALTYDGQRFYEASENELGEGRSPLSPVFHAAIAVITELNVIEDAAN
jgi:hypothetical protein